MPTYDYQCRSCGTVTEVIHSMLVDGPSVCEACGGELRRVLYPAGIIFKGPGFYSTDSRASSSSTSSTPAKKEPSSSGETSTSTSTPASTESSGATSNPSPKDSASD